MRYRPVRPVWEEVSPKVVRHSRNAQPRAEYPVNLDVLNGYVLGVIALFAVCLYVAVVVIGLGELMSGISHFRTRRKRSRNHGATRR